MAYLARFGYGYGYSDQDDVLPFVLALGNPELFASDWFVQEQVANLNVRTYIAYGLWGLMQITTLEWAIALVYVVAFALLASGLYGIYMTATGHQVVSLGAVFVALVLTPQWTLGGNDLAHSMFVPSMLAWGLVLHGLHVSLQQRWGPAGILVGIAVLAQALVGLHVALVLGLLLLVYATSKHQWRPMLVFSGGVLLASSPMLVPLVGQIFTAAPLQESAPSIRTILAEYRAPHHYLATAFPLRSWLRFGLLLTAGLSAAAWLAYKVPQHRYVRSALAMLGVMGLLLVGAAVFTLIWPSTFTLKLQLFKLTVLAKVVLIGLVAAGIGLVVPALDAHVLTSRRWLIVAALLILFACTGVLASQPEGTPWNPRTGNPADEQALMAWARTESPPDALFIVPPTWSGFRTQAERSAVVTLKGFPFTDAAMVEWYTRMQDLVPGHPDGYLSLTAMTEAGYAGRSAQALAAAADAYEATHIVTPLDTLSAFWVQAATFGDWHVHERREVEP